MDNRPQRFWHVVILIVNLGVLALYLYGPWMKDKLFGVSNELRICTFFNVIDHRLFREFELQTGIKLLIKYFDSNSELRTQLEKSRGYEYDVVTPSDYLVPVLSRQNLLEPIDHSRLSNYLEIDKKLLNCKFDPENRYSVPYAWASYGIGYNKSWFEKLTPPSSWAALFEPNMQWSGPDWESKRRDYNVCLLDNPIDVVFAAAVYRYGITESLTASHFSEIAKLLIDCRSWVTGYVEANLRYFLSGICPAVMATSALMKRLIDQDDKFGFVIPKEGSMISIENFCIPRGVVHLESAYKFIDFMLSAKSGSIMFAEYGFIPANKNSLPALDHRFVGNESFFPSDDVFKRFQYIDYDVDLRDIGRMWLDVKSRSILRK